MSKICPWLGLACAFLSWTDAQAQTTWRYKDLVARVVAAHPAVKSAAWSASQREAEWAAAQAAGPLQANGFAMPALGGSDAMYWEGQIDQSITPPGLARARAAASVALAEQGRAAQASASQAARLEVERLVLEWSGADARCGFWSENLDQTESLLQWFSLRAAAGEARAMDAQAAQLQMRRADHEYQVALLDRAEALSALRWLSGDAALTVEAVVLPPLEIPNDNFAEVLANRMAKDARLSVLSADSAMATRSAAMVAKSLLPRPTLGINVQGVPGEVFGGPVVGAVWPIAGARHAQEAARVAAEASAWQLQSQRRALEMEGERVWAKYTTRLAHHKEWSAQIESDRALTANAVELLQQGILDMPTFYILWQAELEGNLELQACRQDILWLRAQLLLDASDSQTSEQ